jgi:hypothetical protein
MQIVAACLLAVVIGQTGLFAQVDVISADASPDNCLQAGTSLLSAGQTKARLRHVAPISPPGLAHFLSIDTVLSFNVATDKDGNVICIWTISGHPLIIPGAIESIRKWKFRPAMVHGQKQAVVGNLIIKVSGSEEGFKTEVLAAEPRKD